MYECLAYSPTCFTYFTFCLYFTGNTYVTRLLTWKPLLLILDWFCYFTFSGLLLFRVFRPFSDLFQTNRAADSNLQTIELWRLIAHW